MTFVVAIALACSLALTPFAGMLAWKFDAVSRPDGNRRLHRQPTPLWGGSAVYLGAVLGVVLSYKLVPGTTSAMVLLVALGASTGMLGLLGCYDDCYDMRANRKLLGQILATLPVVLAGGHIHQLVLFGFTFELGWWGVPLVMGWYVLGINAMNLLDGMDGLASTVGIAVAVGAACIAHFQGNAEATLLALALAGGLAGFLVHNIPPARIYLGDCGSMMIGLTLAVLALQVSLTGPMACNGAVAISLLFVPLLDTGLAIVRRALQRQGLMVADRGHIHHRLLDRGFSIWSILLLLGSVCLLSGAAAWLVAVSGSEFWAWTILAAVVLFSANRRLIAHEEWRLARQSFASMAVRLTRSLSSEKPQAGPQIGIPILTATFGKALAKRQESPAETLAAEASHSEVNKKAA